MSDHLPVPDLRTLLAEAQKPAESCQVRLSSGVVVVLHFEAPTYAQREQVRLDMEGRDNPDELDLRATAAVLVRATLQDGTEVPAGMDWTDFRDLRDRIGVPTYDATIKAKSDSVWSPQWSVPFSSEPSPILETET